jgi:LacI family transcriptional regulator
MKKITALFIAETELTLRSLYYLNLLGKKIPEDISVVATEFEGSTALLYPPITSVVQPLTKLSKTAVETIFKLMDNKEAIPDHMIYIPYSFIERESVIRI